MTGLPDNNKPEFARVAKKLREQGFAVANPAENFGGRTDLDYAEYMRKDIHDLLMVDAVVVLDGWKDSLGATTEVHLAKVLGLPVMTEDLDEVDGGIAVVWFDEETCKTIEELHAAN
jgi:hypothetical protein